MFKPDTISSCVFLFFVSCMILVSQIYGFGSIDLKGMQADNLCNVVPPTSRSTNSIALKFSDSSSGIPVRSLCCFFPKSLTVVYSDSWSCIVV